MKFRLILFYFFALSVGVWGQSYESFDLLETQMELRVLDTLQQRGYYITSERSKELREREQSLNRELADNSARQLAKLSMWTEEQRKAQDAEQATLQTMAVKFGKKIINLAAKRRRAKPARGSCEPGARPILKKLNTRFVAKSELPILPTF